MLHQNLIVKILYPLIEVSVLDLLSPCRKVGTLRNSAVLLVAYVNYATYSFVANAYLSGNALNGLAA